MDAIISNTSGCGTTLKDYGHIFKNDKDLKKKAKKISPDFISTGNIGCMTQISAGTRIPIIHTVELLDWFTGGPKPYKLNNF